MTERFYPTEENLGENCQFWDFHGRFTGCNFPKAEMEGRTSCEGIIDNVCLFLKNGRDPKNIEVEGLKLEPPKPGQKPHVPAGQITPF